MVLGVSTFMIKATGHVPSTKLLVTHLKCQPMILQLTSGVCILISIGTDIAGPSCLLFIGFRCGHHVFRAQSPSAKGGAPGGTKAMEGAPVPSQCCARPVPINLCTDAHKCL